MTSVEPRENETIESLLKRFNKKVATAGIIQEVKSRQAYEKPSDKKRKEKAAQVARNKKKMAKLKQQLEYEANNKFRPRRPNKPRQEGQDGNLETSNHRKNNRQRNNNPRKEYKKNNTPRKPTQKNPTPKALENLQKKFNSTSN